MGGDVVDRDAPYQPITFGFVQFGLVLTGWTRGRVDRSAGQDHFNDAAGRNHKICVGDDVAPNGHSAHREYPPVVLVGV